jgi:hypothetical protein
MMGMEMGCMYMVLFSAVPVAASDAVYGNEAGIGIKYGLQHVDKLISNIAGPIPSI